MPLSLLFLPELATGLPLVFLLTRTERQAANALVSADEMNPCQCGPRELLRLFRNR